MPNFLSAGLGSVLLILCFTWPGRVGAADTSADRFYPVSLAGFYQRSLASYSARDPWGAVPRGLVKFDEVPFLMEGQIELNGMGASRSRNFLPTRLREIPIHRHALRLHLLGGAGYKDPDDTPIAEIRFIYKNGKIRHAFISYGEHVRNWHVESDERRMDVSDPRAHIAWKGTNGATGRPLRLFKNTFDNPLPQEEIQSVQFLSLFGNAFFTFCAVTLEQGVGDSVVSAPTFDEPNDSAYRREALIRVLDANTGKAIANSVLVLTVTEDDRTYGFGRYRSDALGQILVDYPPGRFSQMQLRLSAPDYAELMNVQNDPEGVLPAELTLRCKPVLSPVLPEKALQPSEAKPSQ